MRLHDNIKPTFGGHEKFVFRHGWLKKGVDSLIENPSVFSNDEDALASLGVGKNMVRSIRHWCLATGLVEESNKGGVRSLSPTKLGQKLILDRAWDPYLEDVGSLWLIHWQLCNNPIRSYVWTLMFSSYIEPEFTKKQLQAFLEKQIEQAGIRTTPGTIEREIDCCLRTYVTSSRSKPGMISDERLDCPLAELDLIRFVAEDNVYRFNIGPKPSLPVGIFGYALFRYLSSIVTSRRTIAIDECVYRYGSPGLVFKLDENSIVEYLDALEERTAGKVRVQENAGLGQVYLHESIRGKLQQSALSLLKGHYGQR